MLSAERVLARRHLVLIVLRMIAGTMLVLGGVCLIYCAIRAVVSTSIYSGFRGALDVGSLALGGALALPAIAVLLFDRRIVRWLVPLPRAECPRCSYRLHEHPKQCPECGLVLVP